MDIKKLTPLELLVLHSDVSEELRERGVVRSSNNPTGDLAEYLFCHAFGWTRTGNSHPVADAANAEGVLFQIKGRRRTAHNKSRQLGALRNLKDGGFDFLAAVLFDPDYSINRAVLIPHKLVLENSRYRTHTNSSVFLLRDVVWSWDGVEDVTDKLRAVKF